MDAAVEVDASKSRVYRVGYRVLKGGGVQGEGVTRGP